MAIPLCPKHGDAPTVPSRLMPNGGGNGLALCCSACGEGIPATREQVAEVERRERHRREAEARQDADHKRGVKAGIDVYLAAIAREEDMRGKPAEQLPLWGTP